MRFLRRVRRASASAGESSRRSNSLTSAFSLAVSLVRRPGLPGASAFAFASTCCCGNALSSAALFWILASTFLAAALTLASLLSFEVALGLAFANDLVLSGDRAALALLLSLPFSSARAFAAAVFFSTFRACVFDLAAALALAALFFFTVLALERAVCLSFAMCPSPPEISS